MSFANLKKQSSLGSLTQKLVKEVEKMNNTGGGGDDRLWKPEMDNVFDYVSTGFSPSDITTNLEWEPNNIAWDNSFITGNINGETVFRVQSREGLRNEGVQDMEDSKKHSHSRAEYKTTDSSRFIFGDSSKIEYSFYVPKEVKFSGHSANLFGQMHGFHSDTTVWSVMTLPTNETGHLKYEMISEYEKKQTYLRGKDLVFRICGALDAQGHPRLCTNFLLSQEGVYQGKWNTIEILTKFGKGKNGALKVIFNGNTIVDCICDVSLDHEDYKSEHEEFAKRDVAFSFQFGIHRFLVNPEKASEVVDPVVYYKNVKVIKL